MTGGSSVKGYGGPDLGDKILYFSKDTKVEKDF
jgi:hypothetical protein